MLQELGTGILNWRKDERVSDRYGFVHLLSSLDGEEKVKLVQIDREKHGRLVAAVREIRQSRHCGDLFHGVFPKTPKVGQKITLGKGILAYGEGCVGLIPEDGRETLWLNIRALYKVHEQTVTLYFEELPNK